MNRLTERLPNGVVRAPVTDENRGDSCMMRLAAYEDTGLMPEEVAELAAANKDGRVVVLPIPFGAKKKAYAIANDDLDDEVPKEIVTLDCEEIENLSIWPSGELVVTVDGWEIGNSDIGKTVFLTRAEAEAATDKEAKR